MKWKWRFHPKTSDLLRTGRATMPFPEFQNHIQISPDLDEELQKCLITIPSQANISQIYKRQRLDLPVIAVPVEFPSEKQQLFPILSHTDKVKCSRLPKACCLYEK